ncbi:hypothetical protein Pla123a_26290 [Posidoniimonas polymericola]|uniref:GAF domain-containing protein n=1 Tax=Posidoniimonas polymericola TaxID=2528002 RepID=A0A5C5YLX2_9BACT|nr:GAF domain-containing protein [Posidoniimonas polymericola]TWT75846.1 hypothetical protein Pla123a_26290 [Posidoniimonas polymericola]
MTLQLTANLVRWVEVWRPTEDGGHLELGGTTHESGGETRCGFRYSPGQGVIGRAWESGVPVFGAATQGDFDGQFLEETPAQLIAIPTVRGGECLGVALLACDDQGQAAAELWRINERNELGLAENWYSNLDRFGRISQLVKFPRRAGLPGKVWADRFPRVMGSLATSQAFVRAAGAKAEGLSTAIGIPFMKSAMDLEAVLVLLSASRTPLAKVVEVWAKEPQEKSLKIVSADYGPYIDLAPESRRRRLKLGDGVAGLVYRDLRPKLTTDLQGVEFPRGEGFQEYGMQWGLGVPVFVGDQLVAAVAMFG